MYEAHFGLTKRPFRALAAGSDVFVGPQTAATMKALKKALSSPDAIVAVRGPVGVGKTTLVRRALQAVGEERVIVTIGRMQLGHDEVLELLLEEMGASLPSGTVQRFTTFRRILKEHADNGARVLFVVEDAGRAGADALSELEALTASDAGVSEGANVILMGDENIDEMLASPSLRRLKQRMRLRQVIEPLGAGELMGYLKHCFRLAGREFDEVFEQGSAEVLHRLTGGIPRLANNLVESSMTSAVDNKLETVNVAQIKLVASEEFGLDITEVPSAPVETSTPAPVAEETPAAEVAPVAEETPVADDQPVTQLTPGADEPPVVEAAPVVDKQQDEEDNIPDLIQDTQDVPQLIQDTLPDLEVLAPALANAPAPEAEQEQEDPGLEAAVPELSLEATGNAPAKPEAEQPVAAAELQAAQVEAPAEDVPEWDRDPTLAELRPDLDALEHAMAVAQGLAPAADGEDKSKDEEPAEPVPEITLDREIQAKIDEAAEELQRIEDERAAEEEEEEEDNRTVAEILADAQERDKVDDNSVEAQLESALVAEHPPTQPEIPILQVTEPPAPVAEKPAAAAKPAAPGPAPVEPVVEPVLEKPQPLPEPALQRPELSPEPVIEEPESVPEPVFQELEATPEPAPVPVLEEPEPAPEPVFEEPESGPEPVFEEPEPAPEPVFEAPEPQPAVEPVLEAPELTPQPEPVEEAEAANPQLQQIAVNLSRAKTIDDCDDMMAETLFGEEFSAMAAEVAAMAPPDLPANDDHGNVQNPAMPDIGGAAAVNVELETKPGGLDLSASQRLATVRALNGTPDLAAGAGPEPVVLGQDSPSEVPAADTPDSIEEQINTSMTQTLKALSARQVQAAADEDEDDDNKKSGFFSRFRRN